MAIRDERTAFGAGSSAKDVLPNHVGHRDPARSTVSTSFACAAVRPSVPGIFPGVLHGHQELLLVGGSGPKRSKSLARDPGSKSRTQLVSLRPRTR